MPAASNTAKALQLLQAVEDLEVHLVISKGAEMTRSLETPYSREEVLAMADVVHPIQDLGASISSGSFQTLGMLVAPCSMRSLAAIAHGLSDNLLTRAADVVLKDLYHRPQTVDDILTHSVGRALDLFGISVKHLPRWSGGKEDK